MALSEIVLARELDSLLEPGNTNWRERLGTVDLPIKVACFVKYMAFSEIVLARELDSLLKPGNTNWRGRLSTVDLLINVACFALSEIVLANEIGQLT